MNFELDENLRDYQLKKDQIISEYTKLFCSKSCLRVLYPNNSHVIENSSLCSKAYLFDLHMVFIYKILRCDSSSLDFLHNLNSQIKRC